MEAIVLDPFAEFREELHSLIHRRRELEALADLRRDALNRFEAIGLPSRRSESWRFTDLGGIGKEHFARAGDESVDASSLPVLEGPGHRLVFINGRFSPGLSRIEALPDRVLIASLGQALLTHPELVLAHLERPMGLDDHPFAALNTAFLEDGAFVYLPKGAVLSAPLHLVFYSRGEGTANYPRNLIVMEDAGEATIVEEYRGEGSYLTCPVTELSLASGSVLRFHKIQQEAPGARHLGGLKIHQRSDSRAAVHLISAGGGVNRTDVASVLDGAGADLTLNGLTLVEEGELGDYHLRVDHAVPQASSRQLFKGVLSGASNTVFDSLIHVRKDAQKTDASQNNRNLLLSRRALARSNPRLEILADDVKCSHGSTVGFLDPDALFYMRSRGLGEAEARALLVYAFANESIERIGLQALRERLGRMLAARLSAGPAQG
jgi:Fe-S cluster assembly protein SufD